MITVHHLNNSRSQRVLWLLEELGTPYEIRHYARNATTGLAPPGVARNCCGGLTCQGRMARPSTTLRTPSGAGEIAWSCSRGSSAP